jgi:hypothetical protein
MVKKNDYHDYFGLYKKKRPKTGIRVRFPERSKILVWKLENKNNEKK